MKVKGRVILKTVSKGSKSEYDAVCLLINDKIYLLRQRGKNAFNNPELQALIGKEVEANGEIVGTVFFVRNYTVVGGV